MESNNTDVNRSSIVCFLHSWSASSDIMVPDGFNFLTVLGGCMHTCVHTHARTCMPWTVCSQISFNLVSSRYRTQGVQLGSKHLYQLSQLTGPPPDISLNIAINDNKSKFKIPSIQLRIAFWYHTAKNFLTLKIFSYIHVTFHFHDYFSLHWISNSTYVPTVPIHWWTCVLFKCASKAQAWIVFSATSYLESKTHT